MKKEIGITREQYKDIKKKDHREMNVFLVRWWQDGYKEGLTAARKIKVSPADIEKSIREIKGIGETMVRAVM